MSQSRRPHRLMAALAVVGIALGGVMALPGNARADEVNESFSRPGWCDEGEGQSVVIDWSQTLEVPTQETGLLVRCIKFVLEVEPYPIELNPDTHAVLASAGITYLAPTGVVSSINGIDGGDRDWHFVAGEVTTDGANWLGGTDWLLQEPGINTFVGITLTDKRSDPNRNSPLAAPRFEPYVPNPTPTATNSISVTPSATPSGTASNTTEPGGTVKPSTNPSPSASPSATQSATQPATQTATSTPTATASTPVAGSATPSATASATTTTASPTTNTTRPRRTTRPPRQTYRPQRPTYRPQQPNYPPPPPVQEPPPPPVQEPPPPVVEEPTETALSADPSGEGTGPANAPPSRVWGREDVTRQSADADRPQKPAPWSQLAAVAGAVVVVGGLGTAFARGLQTSTPPVVEEE